MYKLSLPFWESAGQIGKLKDAAQSYYLRVQGWLAWPLSQIDPMTCHEKMLRLLAWERDVERFETEETGLFRVRVKFAYENATDSGSSAGMKRILTRLAVPYAAIEERPAGADWDVVQIIVTDSQMSQNIGLLSLIVQHYGRTCRRYQVQVVDDIGVNTVVYHFDHNSQTFEAAA